jgi:hypothetical protein
VRSGRGGGRRREKRDRDKGRRRREGWNGGMEKNVQGLYI